MRLAALASLDATAACRPGVRLLLTVVGAQIAGAAFDESRAIEYSKLAGAAGCPAAAVEAWSCGWKCSVPVDSVKVCQGPVINAFVGVWEGQCIMSFQGTHDVQSVLADLRFFPDSVPFGACPGCRVHGGFLDAYLGLKPCLIAALKDRGCQGVGIRSTGWSLGAAASSLAIFDLAEAGWAINESYDFGKPRIGNAAFASAFNRLFAGKAWRVTHGHDPVPHLPPSTLSANDEGFQQVEPEAFYASEVKAGHAECTLESDRRCSARNHWMAIDWLHVLDHFYYMGVRQGKHNCSDIAPAPARSLAALPGKGGEGSLLLQSVFV